LGEGVASGAGETDIGGVFTEGCGVLIGGDDKGGTAGLVTAGGTTVLTTSSTAAFEPSTTSPKGFAEAPVGARITVSAAQIPTAAAALAFIAILDSCYPVSGRIFVVSIGSCIPWGTGGAPIGCNEA
jgi:hypothetical protein